MKRTLSIALTIVLLVPSLALAAPKLPNGDTDPSYCTFPPDHGVYSTDGLNTLIGCITKADWDKAMQNQNTVGAVNLPTFAPGSSITDQHGIVYDCSAMVVTNTVCVNVTGTKWYVDDLNGIAKDLIASAGIKDAAAQEYPLLAGWIEAQ